MIKIYIPIKKDSKNKTDVRGYWRNSEGKSFYDYIVKENFTDDRPQRLFYYLEFLKRCYNQESIFYEHNEIGYIFYNRDKLEVLKNCHTYIHKDFKGLKGLLKTLLTTYGGLTIYQENKFYLTGAYKYRIEVYF